MAPLSLGSIKPLPKLSSQAIPQALHTSLKKIFSDVTSDLWLVGGTALAGYYAEHRRSDDLDLFAANEVIKKAAVLSIKSLVERGAQISKEINTEPYYRAWMTFQDHSFTVDVVLDSALHDQGQCHRDTDGILVGTLETLFKMKIATLVSRCSEKDLYDLNWIFSKTDPIETKLWVGLGQEIDSGVSIESLLISLNSATLREEACHFLLDSSTESASSVFNKIKALRKQLIHDLRELEKNSSLSKSGQDIKQALRDIKKLS